MLTETTRLRPDGIGTDVRKNARSTIVLFQELNRCVLYLIRCRCQPDIEMSDNVKLFVGNLPLDATHDELNKLFSPHGEVNTCSLLRQYAFITLKGEGAADRYADTDSPCIPSHY